MRYYTKNITRRCSVPGCGAINTVAFSKSGDFSHSIALCPSCIGMIWDYMEQVKKGEKKAGKPKKPKKAEEAADE